VVIRGRPVADPFPYDAVISGTGYMLGAEDQDGTELISHRPEDQSAVVPSAYGYDAQNPKLGKIQPYERFPRGYGLKTQIRFVDGQYYYAINADASVHPAVKGPNVSTLTPATTDATNGIVKFYELGGTLYALAGRYALYRSSDVSWPVSKDFGSGKAGLDVEVFGSNAGSTVYAFVAMGDADNFWSHDGTTTTTTWTQHASLTALAFVKAGREFYRASSVNTLAKVDSNTDPLTAANWTANEAFRVGDQQGTINRLALTARGELVVLKTDGVFILDGSGQDFQLYSQMGFAPASSNGKSYGLFLDDLYVTYTEGTYRILPDFRLDPIGPERLGANDSEVKGTITAFCAHANLHAYAGLYNPDTGHSYLMKFVHEDVGEDGKPEPVDAWHGSITSKFSSKKITALHKSTVGAASGHSRLYIGFSDGTLAWFTLPCTPNPAACSSYLFSTTDGQLFLPNAHFGFPANAKSLHTASVNLANGSSTNYAQYKYRTSPSGTFTSIGTNYDDEGVSEANFTNGLTGTNLEQQIVLVSSAASSCPQLVGLGIRHTVRPPFGWSTRSGSWPRTGYSSATSRGCGSVPRRSSRTCKPSPVPRAG
jgi:hypothetical protein